MQVGCAEGGDPPATLANPRGNGSGRFGSKKMWRGPSQGLGQWDGPEHY